MFNVWDTERLPPTRQHYNILDSLDKTALQCLTLSLSMCCLCVALPWHDVCHIECRPLHCSVPLQMLHSILMVLDPMLYTVHQWLVLFQCCRSPATWWSHLMLVNLSHWHNKYSRKSNDDWFAASSFLVLHWTPWIHWTVPFFSGRHW